MIEGIALDIGRSFEGEAACGKIGCGKAATGFCTCGRPSCDEHSAHLCHKYLGR